MTVEMHLVDLPSLTLLYVRLAVCGYKTRINSAIIEGGWFAIIAKNLE